MEKYILMLCFVSLFILPVVSAFVGGDGSSGDPFQITNWTDLNSTRDDLTAHYILMNDLSNETADYVGIGDSWNPIGYEYYDWDTHTRYFYYFEGSFNGQGYTISDLKNTVLFRYSEGVIKNIGLINATRVHDNIVSHACGLLVGINKGTIENCYAKGNITWFNIDEPFSWSDDYFVGGLVSVNNGGVINNSYANVGIIINITNELSDLLNIGAIPWYLIPTVGGLVGRNTGTVIDSYSISTIVDPSDPGVVINGLIGTNSGTVTNSFYDYEFTGVGNSSSNYAKNTTEMKSESTYSSWDISGKSDNLNDGYPYLNFEVGRSSSPFWHIYSLNLAFLDLEDDSESLTDSGTGHFNVTVENTNGTVMLHINNTNVTATHLGGGKYNTTYTFTSAGVYEYKWYAYNLDNVTLNESVSTNYTVLDSVYPTFSNYEDNNGTLDSLGYFNVTVANTNGTVILNINNTNVTATHLGGGKYNATYNFTSAGVYEYKWYAYGNGPLTNLNESDTQLFTYGDLVYPTFSNYEDSLNFTTGYFNVTVANTNGTVMLHINNTNVTATHLGGGKYNATYTFTESGAYQYKWYAYGDGPWNNLNESPLQTFFFDSFCGSGDGSIGNPYLICNWTHLDLIRFGLDLHYALNNSLDSSTVGYVGIGDDFDPIGYAPGFGGFPYSDQFTGSLDGQSYTISNLIINKTVVEGDHYIGLFSYLVGNVSNLGLVDIYVEGNGLYLGSVAGYGDDAYVNNSYVTGILLGATDMGGIIGRQDNGVINNTYFIGNLSQGSSVGGIAGYSSGIISNSNSTSSNILGINYVGGLVGSFHGVLSDSYFIGNVSGSLDTVGGLVGHLTGNISNSYSISNVTSPDYVGGLVGNVHGGIINNSYSQGSVTATGIGHRNHVGGLVGNLSGVLSEGNIVRGIVTNSNSSSTVQGCASVGGLVGTQTNGLVSNSYSTGNISGSTLYVGGLVGYQYDGIINNSYTLGNVSGSNNVGGVVGRSDGIIINSYSTGNIYASSSSAGGVVGRFTGTINNSYSTGIISGDYSVGGLVGWLETGYIYDSYSTGNISGYANVGGLVGKSRGTVTNSYSIGSVSGIVTLGGLVGLSAGTVTNSYYNSETSGQSDTGKGEPKTTLEMIRNITTFSSWDIEYSTNYTNEGYPFLSWQISESTPIWLIYENNLPTIDSVYINNTLPGTIDDLLCVLVNTTDLDGDNITLVYDWELNGSWLGINDEVLLSGNTSDNDLWRCRITPSDMFGTGDTVFSSTIGINITISAPLLSHTNATTSNTSVLSTSTSPTNNNSYVRLSVNFTDATPTTKNYTAYFCKSSSFDNGCVHWCNVSTSTLTNISCDYNITPSDLTTRNYYYVFIMDNHSMVSNSLANSFYINHPPTSPNLVTPYECWTNSNVVDLSFSATDLNSHSVRYVVYNSSDNTTFSHLVNTSSLYEWTIPGTFNEGDRRYLRVYSYDQYNYTNEVPSYFTITLDETSPTIITYSVSSTSVTTSDSVTFYGIANDSVSDIRDCDFTLLKTDYNGGRGVGQPFNITSTTSTDDTYSVPLSMASLGTGTLQFTNVYCRDYSGNYASNTTDINITISSPSTSPTGGGSSTTTTTVDNETMIALIPELPEFCGDGICQEGENPINCPQDCPFNIDEVFCFLTNMDDCEAWVFSMLTWVIIGSILFVAAYRQMKLKR
jgi:hypothetical protein